MPWLVGEALLRRAWPEARCPLLRTGLGLGLGLGLCSCTFFLAGLLLGIAPAAVFGVDALLALAALVALRGADRGVGPAGGTGRGPVWLLVGLVAVVGMVTFVAISLHRPHGDGDAMATWNLRAHFLARAWGQWDLVFGNVGLAHTDYPLLLPLLVTRAWVYGAGDVLAPAGMAFVFTFGSLFSLAGTLAWLRGGDGPVAALMGALALVGTPFFVHHGASQAADVPLAYFTLAAVALGLAACRADGVGPTGLCGFALGCAAWTKNEGAMVAVVLGAALLVTALRRAEPRAVVALVVGAALPVTALVVFKTAFDVGNDLVEAHSVAALVDRLFDAERWLLVVAWFGGQLWSLSMEGEHGGWGFVPLLAYAVCAGRAPGARVPWAFVVALAIVIAGYFMVFVAITPYDLDWHLRTTSGRLLLQVWPATLMVAFSVAWVPGSGNLPSVPCPAQTARS